MTATDHLDGEIRRALQELGDAAGPPPAYGDLWRAEVTARRRPARGLWLGAAAMVLVGLTALVVVARTDRGPRQVRTGTVPASVPVTADPTAAANPSVASAPVTAESTATSDPPRAADPTATSGPSAISGSGADAVHGGVDAPLAEVIRAALPAGFTLLGLEANPLHAIAYDERGIRLDLDVFLGADAATVLADGGWTATADGQARTDVATAQLLTTAGDHLVASASFGDGQEPPAAVEGTAAHLPDLLAAVGRALSGTGRDTLLDVPDAWVGAGGIGDVLAAAVRTAIALPSEPLEFGSRGGGRGWLDQYHGVGDPLGRASVSVAATSTSVRLLDADVTVDPARSVTFRWVGGWQLVVTANGADALALLPAATEAAIDVFATWTPTTPVAGCGTYTVVAGDFLYGIAEKAGTTLDALLAVNDGLEGLVPGQTIQLPCAPARPPQRSADPTGLADFARDHPAVPTAEFVPGAAVVVASDTDVWVATGGSGIVDTDRPGLTVGKVRIDHYDRLTGDPAGSAEVLLQRCASAIEPLHDPAAPLDAVPVRCTGDGTTGTIDVFDGRSPEYTATGTGG